VRYALLVSSVLLIVSGLFAQSNDKYFEITDYNGGINVKSDTGSLAPNEALVIENLDFDNYGSLQKRNGYTYWNTHLLPSGDTIKDIHYLYCSKGSNRILIGTNNFIYASPFTDTITSAINWKDQRIGYSRGVIDLYKDSSLVYGDTVWWLGSIKVGDSLVVADSSFEIDSILADTCIRLDRDWVKDDSADVAYKAIRTMVGDPYINSWNSNAYIADEHSSAFYYADSQCYWLTLMDSGAVDTVYTSGSTGLDVDTTMNIFYTQSYDLHRIIELKSALYDTISDLLDADATIFVQHPDRSGDEEITRTIIRQFNTSHVYWITNLGENVPNFPNEYEVSGRVWTPVDIGNTIALMDSSKAMYADDYVGLYFVRGSKPDTAFTVSWNSGNQIGIERGDPVIDTMFLSSGATVDNRYYVFGAIPYGDMPDSISAPHFKQTIFHKNVLYAYGYELDADGDTVNTGFIYHSDIGLPKKWSSFEGFDLSLNAQDRPTAMFKLYDYLMICTNNGIYRLVGWPPAIGNGAVKEIISTIGVDSYNSVVRRDNNYAYLARKDGFYIFDGSSVKKISRKIDPLIDQYRSGGYELGYYNEYTYFSFPDSDYTFVYYEPTGTFTRYNFGISVMNNQATLVDSSYFLFSHPSINSRRIFQYPTSFYVDSLDTSTVDTIAIRYKTGRMDFGSIQFKKTFERFFLVGTKKESNDTIFASFRTNFSSSVGDTAYITSGVSSYQAYRVIETKELRSLFGRYCQLELYAKTTDRLAFGKWGIKYKLHSEKK